MESRSRKSRTDALIARLNASERKEKLAVLFLAPFLTVLCGLVVFFIYREQRLSAESQRLEIRETAAAFFEQIVVARLWNAGHGGVYVEIKKDTQPNPYLEVPDRDIVSIEGKRYTKVNPAYMTRQLSDIARRRSGIQFRIIGMRPLNPANTPNAWEREALVKLEKGKSSEAVTRFMTEDGKRYFHYLAPLRIEKPCLACHEKQGYVVGDLKGGITVSVPMSKFDALLRERMKSSIISLSVIGLVSGLFITVVTWYLSHRLGVEMRANIEREKLKAVVELAGAAAHEMRQPLSVVNNMVSIIDGKLQRGEPVEYPDLETVRDQCGKIDGIIRKLLSITNYRTRQYTEGVSILDISASSGAGKGGDVKDR